MYNLIRSFDAIKTSMLVDYEQGRALELDAICGAVMSRHQRLGIDAPYTRLVYALLSQMPGSGQH
jgi:2-dehydropantoate 2-reductase